LSGIRLGISSGEQLGAGVGEFDVGPGFVSPQPALRDRALDAGAVFGRTAAGGEKGAIDPLNIDAAVLDGFRGVGDLDQLSDGGFRITERSGLGELHGLCARR
jgi:hypothetical protein